MKMPASLLYLLLCLPLACGKSAPTPVEEKMRSRPIDARYLLMITCDFGSVRRCSTLNQLHNLARIMTSSRADIMALDASANGLCNYHSAKGHFRAGSPFDALFAQGIDPLQKMTESLHTEGITVLANVRMNDHHGALDQWTPWEREHVQWSLRRDTGSRDWKSVGALRQMDFAIEGVRDYRFSIIQEIVDRYEVDGIQLDFGRTAPFLSEPRQEKAHYLTDYVRRIRTLLDQGGRSRLLSVIVPWDTNFCLQQGLQVDRWISDGLIDLVCPGEWYYADWNIPLDQWVQWTKGTPCRVVPHTPGNVSPYQVFEFGEPSLLGENHVLDSAKIRAIAQNYFAQNVHGMMFYNFYADQFGDDYPYLRDWLAPETRCGSTMHFLHSRRLLYQPSELDCFDIGTAFQRLPLRKAGDWVDLPFQLSGVPDSAALVLRLAVVDPLPGDDLHVRLNDCDLDNLRSGRWQLSCRVIKGRSALIAQIPLEQKSLQNGKNVLMLQLAALNKNRTAPLAVGEFEIVVHPQCAGR